MQVGNFYQATNQSLILINGESKQHIFHHSHFSCIFLNQFYYKMIFFMSKLNFLLDLKMILALNYYKAMTKR